MSFIVIKTLTITILEEEATFVNPNHVALGAKTVLFIKPALMTGTSCLMKLEMFDILAFKR